MSEDQVTTAQFDRLVDGEVSTAERRAILMSLEQDSEGWRRLALAFLEAQALREGLRGWTESSETRTQTPPTAKVRQRVAPHWAAALTVAGVAFCLGWLARHGTVDTVPTVNTPVLVAARPVPPPPGGHNADAPVEHQTLRLRIPDPYGKPQEFDVPVVDGHQLESEDLIQAAAIPQSVHERLQKTGRNVYEQRHLYYFTLDDGRRGVVPVSDVIIEPTSTSMFQ